MNTPRQAARQRRSRRHLMLYAASAVIVAGLLATLVAVSSPGRSDAPRPAAAAPSLVTTQAPATAPASASATSGTPVSPTPKAAPSTPSARPSPTTARPPGKKTAAPAKPKAGRLASPTHQGVATAYEAKDGNGACLFGPSADLMVAAMNTMDYETSQACGSHVLVRAANGKSVTVRITNECPLPCAPGQIDLSQQAFAKLADLKVGRIPITWSVLSPATSEKVSIRYKTGSSPHWCALQALGHRNPVAGLEVRTASGWRKLSRTAFNYFIAADGNGCGGAIRLTDIYGERLTLPAMAVRADVVQPTGAQFARH
ncbi:expansin EXLX1 family cellulose-binding protein [Streptomyces sp. NBC_00237]|uniref:expansin EXLX1 family cellulose-binding protein n=1 Tax=Streptomyces sp. NBC_00237 TaxID=2975687 RepID=UPI002259ED70|nr:expansin EXLX1 family cellulose-binding protein [Streptomyces sp. NBC_00237]MCX5206301.1 expansin EXLX1 family cellulose-binding protein [Streptomyces sp. NBC_00237]